MKIQSLGNGTGRPVNPFSAVPVTEFTEGPFDYAYFEEDNPALPLYLNNEPYIGSDVVEGERVDEVYVPYDDIPGWKPIHPNERLSDYSKRGYDTREIYRITPSAPDNDKKVAEVREGMEIIGVWLDVESQGSIYAGIDSDRLIVKFEDGSVILYNQDNWPKLIATHILILPL